MKGKERKRKQEAGYRFRDKRVIGMNDMGSAFHVNWKIYSDLGSKWISLLKIDVSW